MVEITEVETRPSSSSLHDEVLMSRENTAAVKLQKVYRSYRTRRNLVDAAVVGEERWAAFSNFVQPENGISRWNCFGFDAQAANGSCKQSKDQKLAFQTWISAIDPRHRCGRRLYQYYRTWGFSATREPFFYWLDIGDGKNLDLRRCRRSKLQRRIMYLGHEERKNYEYIVVGGRIVHKLSGNPLDTSNGANWIFVVSNSNILYAGEKKNGILHQSFLSGSRTLAAGRVKAKQGIITSLSPHSDYYPPTEVSFDCLSKLVKLSLSCSPRVQRNLLQLKREDYKRSIVDARRIQKLSGSVLDHMVTLCLCLHTCICEVNCDIYE